MTFFNKKEDTIKIELTPYGRSLLSKGKLKPHYYAFHDDDILYDSKKGGFEESNSNSKYRILTGSISLKPLITNKGVESNIYNTVILEHENYLPYPIGTSKYTEKKNAAWDITFLRNEIASTNYVLSSSTTTTLNIPQIECEIEYTMSLKSVHETERFPSLGNSILTNIRGNLVDEGSEVFLDVEEEDILIYLLEQNGFKYKDSFEAQVYLYDEDEKKIEKLNFMKERPIIVNDIMIERNNNIEEPAATPSEVEYYFNLATDYEVPEEHICLGLKNLKRKDIFVDLEFECPDRDPNTLAPNIYKSTITGPEEDCD